MAWHVYFLKSAAGDIYVGYTGREPATRLLEHNSGLNRWTRARRPWMLAHFEVLPSKIDAIRRERFFKTGTGRRLRDDILNRSSLSG